MTKEALNKLNEQQLKYCTTLSVLIARDKENRAKEQFEKDSGRDLLVHIPGGRGILPPVRLLALKSYIMPWVLFGKLLFQSINRHIITC